MFEAFKGLLTGFNPSMDMRAGMPGFNPPGLLGPAGAPGPGGILTGPSTPAMGMPGGLPGAPPGASPAAPGAPSPADANPLVKLFRETYDSIDTPKDDVWTEVAVMGSSGVGGVLEYRQKKEAQKAQQALGTIYAEAAARGLPPEMALQAYAASGHADPDTLAKLAQLDMDRQRLAIDQGRFGWEVRSGMPDFKGDVAAEEAAGKAPFAPYQKIEGAEGTIYVQPGVTDGVIPGRDESNAAIQQERRLADVKREEARYDKAMTTLDDIGPKMDNLTYVKSLLEQIPDEIELGGPGAEKLQEMRQLAIGLGMNQDQEFKSTTALLEALRSETEKMISAVRPPGSGATSDLEYKSYKEAVAGLGKTKEGNRMVINYNIELLKRSQAKAQAFIQWRDAGKDMRSFDKSWNAIVEKNPPSWMQ